MNYGRGRAVITEMSDMDLRQYCLETAGSYLRTDRDVSTEDILASARALEEYLKNG